MNEDWRNAFGILMCREICDGVLAQGYAMARHRLTLDSLRYMIFDNQ